MILIIFYNIINYANNFSSKLDLLNTNIVNTDFYFSTENFFWPLPGFHTITSPFGPRTSPTVGSSSNHSGIDISAPQRN